MIVLNKGTLFLFQNSTTIELKVCPDIYAAETGEILFGSMLPHDDSVNDRTAGSKLNNSQDVTQKLWKGKSCFIALFIVGLYCKYC